jgi:endonuclease/exonuclease/phosphatase (EEP) superfamily protein YafD
MRTLRIVLTALVAPPLFIGTAVCATAALAGWLGAESLRWDLLPHFAPVWLAGGLVGLAASFFFRGFDRAALFVAGVIGTVAAGGLVGPELLRSTGAKAEPGAAGQIKVVQFNVWHSNPDVEGVVRWLAKEDPDIAVLEETTPQLRARIGAEAKWHMACPDCEVMILSKRPPVSAGAPRTAVKAEGPLSRATYRDTRGEFTVIGVHYAWPTDPHVQQPQEARLAEAIGRYPRARTIAAGDFNSAPWAFARRRWDEKFGLIRRDRALFTWPARQPNRYRWLGLFPFLALDHVYAGEDWATVSVRRGPRIGSDHYPVVVTLAPRARR